MIRGWTFIFVFGLMGSGAIAQEIRADSGEHATFSRVVLPLPIEIDWSIVATENQVQIAFSDNRYFVVADEITQKLPANRIIGAQSQPGVLTLDLGCACSHDVFRFNEGFLVIDIVDTPLDDAIANVEAENTAVNIVQTPRVAYVIPEISLNTVAEQFVMPDVSVSEGPAIVNETTTDFEDDALARLVAEVISSNLLEETGVFANEAGNDNLEAPTQMVVSDAFRRQLNNLGDTSTELCRVPEELNTKGWAPTAKTLSSLGALRENLYKENGDVAESAARALAGAYISLGFGVEARQILVLADITEGVLWDTTFIVDGGAAPASSTLSEMYACQNDMAFWAVLSRGAIPNDPSLDTKFVEATLAAMSVELRQVYAEPLITRFSNAGFESAVLRIKALMARSPGMSEQDDMIHFDESAFRDLPLDLRLTQLRSVAFLGGADSARALLALLIEHREARLALDDELLTFVAASLNITEQDEIRHQLEDELLVGLLIAGRPFVALEKLNAYEDETRKNASLETLVQLGIELVDAAEFPFFAAAIERLFPQRSLTNETTLSAAERALTSEAPRVALSLLRGTQVQRTPRASVVEGQAYLLLGDPSQALLSVSDLDSLRARQIKAQAYMALGDAARAYDLLPEGDPIRAKVGWISDRSESLALQDELRQDLYRVANSAPLANSDTPTVSQLILQNETITQNVRDLLRAE